MAKLSNTSSTTTQRKSFLLSPLKPVEYSLTEGTSIPAPEHTPPRSPSADFAPPPTPGRGPLNSHPTTPPADDVSEMEVDAPPPTTISRERYYTNGNSAPAARMMSSDDTSSFKTPTSPASAATAQHTSSPSPKQSRRPSGMRKLLSLSNLRSSFSSSRQSLAIPRSSHDTGSNYNSSLKRPSSPSMYSTTASSIAPSQHLGSNQNQPAQQQDVQPEPRLRHKKSGGNWFKRKSSLFLPLNNNDEQLDAVAEDSSAGAYRPDTRESKRVKPSEDYSAGGEGEETEFYQVPEERKPSPPPPVLPEIGRGSFSGGDLGWDDAAFRR